MAILNLTPDSFSDGGLHAADSPETLLPTLRAYLSSGATILDIGGQSTRPHAPQVSAEEELSRILPTIRLLRSLPEFDSLAISVDTYRASVARAAISAGADIVNDVSAGTLDPEMLTTVASLGCSIVLMHMRGTPETMNSLTDYSSHKGGLLPTLAHELAARVAAAQDAGIRRWRILLDPGIGFAKTQEQNLELLRRGVNSDLLRGLPWVWGSSRKSFVGRITGVKEPSERAWGTAATVAAAVKAGADVVRVHDVKEMAQVCKMADAIWRVEEDEEKKREF
jgi:2-amino-4-hydroxy-6-hydroxymethyldihydropteridine diphosphokinase/dihydropteroate synthase